MENPWRLGYEKLDPDTGDHVWVILRVAFDEEIGQVKEARSELRTWMIESPYSRLDSAYLGFLGAMSRTGQRTALAGKMDGRDLQAAADTWLGRLRAFDDQTSHLVSSAYGKESAQYKAWVSSLSAEFDANFAYRFCWKLRNYAQHVREPIQNMNFTNGEDERGGVETSLRIEFDPSELLDRYSDWGKVRADLERLRGRRIDVVSTIASAQASCNRVISHLIVAEDARIEGACKVIEDCGREVTEEGSLPIFIKSDRSPDGAMTAELSPIPLDLAATARNLMAKCREVVEGKGAGDDVMLPDPGRHRRRA